MDNLNSFADIVLSSLSTAVMLSLGIGAFVFLAMVVIPNAFSYFYDKKEMEMTKKVKSIESELKEIQEKVEIGEAIIEGSELLENGGVPEVCVCRLTITMKNGLKSVSSDWKHLNSVENISIKDFPESMAQNFLDWLLLPKSHRKFHHFVQKVNGGDIFGFPRNNIDHFYIEFGGEELKVERKIK